MFKKKKRQIEKKDMQVNTKKRKGWRLKNVEDT